MFLAGSVATDDGTSLPDNVIVERVCNARVRQQVYASHRGEFNMELGSMADSVLDASGDSDPKAGTQNKATTSGISRHALMGCEMRASASGFRSDTVNLVELTPSGRSVDVGAIVVHRTTKVKGMTLSVAPYKASKDARRAYEKGLEAVKNGKLADARQHFEAAVKIYPRYANAWFELGNVLRTETEKDAARAAYQRATAIDNKFLPPYFSLASMAFEEQDWTEVLGLTRYILQHDSLDYAKVPGYVLDLDVLDYSQAYFYNAAANFKLNRIAEAEKSGLQAERLDVRPRYPQLRLLLAEIFVRNKNYAGAIDQLQTYLTIVPNGRNADQAREQLAKLEILNSAGPASEKTDQN
jgi:tetratricopeptide (TPR) repeat protein